MSFGPERLLRLEQVLGLTGLSKATLYQMVAAGEFPRPVRIGRRAVAWRESAVQVWIFSRPIASKQNWR